MKNELEKFATDLQLITQTVEQLNKDLTEANGKIFFSKKKDGAFDEINFQLCNILRSMKKNSSALSSLLYRVDIPEKNFSMLVKQFSGEEFIAKLSEAILYREFVKVSIKNFYKE